MGTPINTAEHEQRIAALEAEIRRLQGKNRSLDSQLESLSIRLNHVDEVESNVMCSHRDVEKHVGYARALSHSLETKVNAIGELQIRTASLDRSVGNLHAQVNAFKQPWYKRIFK